MTEPHHQSQASNLERDDARTDFKTFCWLGAFFAGFLVVDVLSITTERSRDGSDLRVLETIIFEVTSVTVIAALLPAIAWMTTRATPGQHAWRSVIATHAGGSIVFSAVHIMVMVTLRKIIFLVALGETYTFSSNLLRDAIYEYRKDFLTYLLIVFFITFGRQLAQQRREIAAAREDAKKTQRITLKSGGRSFWVDAKDIHWVKSAANYIEVVANGKTHLARSTLGAIERQLVDAGAPAARIHRSYIINTDHVREIRPTGEGDVKIEMSDGAIIPGSRRFRDRLPNAS